MKATPFRRLGRTAYRALRLAPALALAGCAAPQQAPLRADDAQDPQAQAPRIVHVVEGAALVAPILAQEAAAPGVMDIARPAGSEIRALVRRFEARAAPTGDWFSPRVDWQAVAPDQPAKPPAPAAAFHAVIIPASAELKTGEQLRVGKQTIDVRRWRRMAPSFDAPPPALPASLEARLAPMRADPAQAWRIALLQERLAGAPPGAWLLASPAPDALAAGAALAALEAQTRLRWGVALFTLHRIEPELAQRVRQALSRTVRFASGVEAPAWRVEPDAEGALLQDLLAPAFSDAHKRESARAWLSRQPIALAWIIDDASGLHAAQAQARVGVVNLAQAPVDAQVRWSESEPVSQLQQIAPGQVMELHAPAQLASRPLGAAGASLEVSVGAWNSLLLAQRAPIAAVPPGVRIRGFAPTWTMQAWLSASAAMSAGLPATTALLQRTVDDAGWELYVECAAPIHQDASVDGEDVVRIFLGPRGKSRAILRLDSDGALVDELALPDDGPSKDVGPPALPARPPHGKGDQRWWVIAPIPAWAIEEGALLRIGIERRVGASRSHWPRPVFPWEDEPARALVDLSRWSPLGGP